MAGTRHDEEDTGDDEDGAAAKLNVSPGCAAEQVGCKGRDKNGHRDDGW
ncbi:hypothetical protein [Luteipulveratus halotolerans]|nr:hypothetical protein [Luteipulveratus halotolerans]